MLNKKQKKVYKGGDGLINNIINKLPIELHLPGYQYCGPGTKLEKRLRRGDPGINSLDQACKEHDIAYTKNSDINERNIADKILASKAWKIAKSKKSNFSERLNSTLVTGIMKAKTKFGMGVKNKKKKGVKNKKKKVAQSFRAIVKNVSDKLKKAKKHDNVKDVIKTALATARIAKKSGGQKKKWKTPRIIPIPKVGGVLPFLIPLFAGLSALGALSGGVSGIAKAINTASQAKKNFEESHRHNKTMEAIAMGKGLYLKPYRTGLGLYLNPKPKN